MGNKHTAVYNATRFPITVTLFYQGNPAWKDRVIAPGATEIDEYHSMTAAVTYGIEATIKCYNQGVMVLVSPDTPITVKEDHVTGQIFVDYLTSGTKKPTIAYMKELPGTQHQQPTDMPIPYGTPMPPNP